MKCPVHGILLAYCVTPSTMRWMGWSGKERSREFQTNQIKLIQISPVTRILPNSIIGWEIRGNLQNETTTTSWLTAERRDAKKNVAHSFRHRPRLTYNLIEL
jgi:hypothetical protein